MISDDDNLDLDNESVTEVQKSWLPDFGEPPLQTRDRQCYSEPAAAHHYSENDNEAHHRQVDAFSHYHSTKFTIKKDKVKNKHKHAKRKKAGSQKVSPTNDRKDNKILKDTIVEESGIVDSHDKDPTKEKDPRLPVIDVPLKVKGTSRNRKKFRLHRRTGDQIVDYVYPATIFEETENITAADKDEIISHRRDDVPGIRRHIITRTRNRHVKFNKIAPISESIEVPSSLKGGTSIASIGTTPAQHHEVFVELDELVVGTDNELQWKEKARWIKFEEDVEDNEVWSKPQIASLTFQSLWEVRKGVERGICLLDLQADSLPLIAGELVGAMVREQHIRQSDAVPVMNALLLKHSQTYIKENYKDWSHFLSDFVRPNDLSDDKPREYETLYNKEEIQRQTDEHMERRGSIRAVKAVPKIMSRIPANAEGTTVLVGQVDFLEQPVMAFIRLAEPADLGDVLSLPIPVRFLFVLLGPSGVFDYHEVGRAISTLMANADFHDAAYEASSKRSLLKSIRAFLDEAIVLPPGQLENKNLLKSIEKFQAAIIRRRRIEEVKKELEEEADKINPLFRTGRPWGAMCNDIRRRYTKYVGDLTDGLNLQCLASTIFLYFAILSPAITFGGLLEEKTEKMMGVSETLIGSAACGIFCSILLGQPLLVVGITGPNVVFEEALYSLCVSNDYNFLAMRWWVGFWMLLITWLFTAGECSFFISKFTRFTEEIFSILISLIFIVETFKKLAKTYKKYPVETIGEFLDRTNSSYCWIEGGFIGDENHTFTSLDPSCDYHPNTSLLATLLLFGTFILAFSLRGLRGSKFLSSAVRRKIGDFGVPISIIVLVIAQINSKVYTTRLNVPDAFTDGIVPTSQELRQDFGGGGLGGWWINPMGTEKHPIRGVEIGIALPFAVLCFILIFVESQLAEMIISGPDRKLQKGVSYHLNIFVIGSLNGILSIFGLPWVCAASVRTLTHLNAVTKTGGQLAPGEQEKVIGAHEQRLTGFFSSLLLATSVLLGSVLKEVPTAVLFGIFLYMGVVSLDGLQLSDRVILFFMPAKYHPDFRYIRKVRPLRVHLFSFIQVVCIGILWAVKSSAAAIAFPFFLVLCVPCRIYLLPKIFTKKELHELDNETLDDIYDVHDNAYAEAHAVPNYLIQD